MALPSIGRAETAIFLRDPSPEPVRAARDLWDSYSGAPGLLDGRGYTYNPETRRYTRTNRTRVSDSQLRAHVLKVSQQTEREMRKATQQVIAGVILVAVWHARMQDLMAALYRAIWVLSIGGFLFEDDTQRNLFYLFVLLQFEHLDNFYFQMLNKIQPWDGRAMNRAGMYGDYGNSLWQNILLEQQIAAGRKEAKRVLGENENHCHDTDDRPGCVELSQLGWIPIALITPLGEATCYSRCHCRIIYR